LFEQSLTASGFRFGDSLYEIEAESKESGSVFDLPARNALELF